MRQALLSSVLICAAAMAQAQDEALIVGISDYANLPDVSGAQDVAQAGNALGRVGFNLFGSGDGTTSSEALQAAGNAFATVSADADRMVVVMAGQFVTDGARTWLLASDAAQPAPFSIGRRSLSVDTALDLLARAPGAAVLVLGVDPNSDLRTGPGFSAGVGDLAIPSGVTVVRGRVDAVRGLVRDTLAVPGGDLIGAVRRDRNLSVSGFVPDRLALVPADRGTAAPAPTTTSTDLRQLLEASAWDRARREDTQASYADYLDQYPDGAHTGDAVARLRDLRDPNRALKAAEDALNLTLEARRAIQRDLQVLGFDTRGIDGIFGPGTRGAIRTWQGQNNVAQSGYLTAQEIRRIDEQAARRSAELERQAEERRAANLAADRAYWDQTGAKDTGAGLRDYLERYPDGVYAEQARASLTRKQQISRANAAAEDRAFWDRMVAADNVAAYNRYLSERPNGAFRNDAAARIRELQQATNAQPANDAAIAAERALALDPISLRLIEARLAQLGLEPGNADGRIDSDTRKAIRRYQNDRQLTVTGYLDQATVSRMLTDAFR